MSSDMEEALEAVANWRANHPDGGARHKLNMSDISFGKCVMFAGSVVIVAAYTRRNFDLPYDIHVHFACDQRKITFPVTLDQLQPLSAPNTDRLVH